MYLALYRKYRPRTFDDVISQPQIVTTLKNQIATGQNTHAYLFTGSRGTGKTTCAKILAMALNCKHPVNGNPCLECENCREIADGSATDIVEMDAASNNKVEDVHILQDQLAYTPVSCKYRVYIVDEVHMLSTAAFNALLKTIEEPPAHVVFILATTELHKVPATIVSRCQRFEFRRIDVADSSARLLSVAAQEGVSLTDGAADMISRISDGGMRDALSLLDRCISVSREVTEDTVRECAGVADNRRMYQLAEFIAAKDIPGCIMLLEQLYKAGKDIARVMDELGMVFRDLMLSKSAPGEHGLLSVMPSDYDEIDRIAGAFTLQDILRCLTLIQECTDGISKTRQRRTVAEMCFVKLCTGAPTAAQAAAVQSAGAAPATQPVQKPAEFKPMGSEFAPRSDDKLSPSQAAAVKKLQKIFDPTAQEAPKSPAQPAPMPAEPKTEPIKPEKPEIPAEPEKPAEKTAAADIAKNQNRLQELLKQNAPAAKSAGAPESRQENPAPAAVPEAPEFAPMPEMNSAPAAPESDFAPPPEEPPAEFVPQREFDTAPEPAISAQPEPVKNPEPVAKPVPEPEPEPEIPPKKEEAPQEEPAGGYEKISAITPEEWQGILAKVNDALYAAMLEDSTATVSDGVLVVHTGNLMLQGMTAKGTQELERILSQASGKKLRAMVSGEEKDTAAEDKNSAVKELLEKARQLNIDVQIK